MPLENVDGSSKDKDVASMARMVRIKRQNLKSQPARQNTSEQLKRAVLRKLSGRS